ncbi:glycosyltransferase [bacterium]|nr:glycosyltransferase [bacterium]
MKSVWPEQYHNNPNIDKPIEQIWADIDGYTFEERYEDYPELHSKIPFVIPLPPVKYEGKFLKGVCFSCGTRVLVEKFPEIKELFNVVANSMFSSYPWSNVADAYFTCYKNEARERWYKENHPDKKDMPMIPLQDADFLNEYYIAPVPNTEKIYDVICVSTPFPVKNLPLIAKALLEYERKYGRVLKVVYIIGQPSAKRYEDGTFDYSGVIDYGKNVLKEVDRILGDTRKYIDFYPWIDYKDLPLMYSRSKCGVLGSLIEGKNRFISEIQSCNTPIIVFKDFNKYSRGDFPVFFGNSGEYVPEFTPESLADTIHKVITNQDAYEPRKNYLEHYGRKNFIDTIVDAIPYYRENLPGYEPKRTHDNLWLDLACYDNYQVSYHDFLYDKKTNLSHVVGLSNVETLLKYYYAKFGIKWKYNDSVFKK